MAAATVGNVRGGGRRRLLSWRDRRRVPPAATPGPVRSGPTPIALAAAGLLVAGLSLSAMALLPVPVAAQGAEPPVVDVRVTGAVEQGPPGGGVTTGDEMRYRITIANRGPDPIPGGALLLELSVAKASGGLATIEVARFSAGALIPAPGGDCGVGRRQVLRCTNRQDVAVDGEFTVVVGHRHPAAEADQLSFQVMAAPRAGTFTDPDAGNNSYRGPTYVFANPPTTTTASTTTMASTSTSDGSSSTTDPSASTSSTDTTVAASSTTADSSTTTTEPTTTTVPSTTTTTVATTTTAELTTTTLEAMIGSDATLVPRSSSSVLGAIGEAEPTDPSSGSEPLALGPRAEDGGPPYLLLGGLAAVLILLGGIALALHAYHNQSPPLVDLRDYDH